MEFALKRSTISQNISYIFEVHMPDLGSMSYHLLVVAILYKNKAQAMSGSHAYELRVGTPGHPSLSLSFRALRNMERKSFMSLYSIKELRFNLTVRTAILRDVMCFRLSCSFFTFSKAFKTTLSLN